MCSSGVLPSPESSSLNATKAAGDNELHMSILPFGGFGGLWNMDHGLRKE